MRSDVDGRVCAGYATKTGTVLQGGELMSLVAGLEANDLIGGYTHMLTVRTCSRGERDT